MVRVASNGPTWFSLWSIDALGDDHIALSATVNEIPHAEAGRSQRAAALAALLDRLEAERGRVDPQQVEEFRHLLR